MLIRLNLIIWILFLAHSKIYNQELQFGGYTKYLFSSYKFQNLNENLIDHTLHSRVNLKLFLNESISFSAGVRNRIIYGESIDKIPDFSKQISENDYLLKLNTFIWNKTKSINFIEVDRAYLDFSYEKVNLSLGRQRIAWGTSLVWNITDLFNPLSILDFDYEERPASDAVRLQVFPSITSRIDFSLKFGKTRKDFTSAIQFYFNKWEYDFYFLVGYHRLRPVIGTSWSGDISDAGFRGEILLSTPPGKTDLQSQNSFLKEKRIQLSAVLSLDYTFSNSLYIHSEAMFNNIGKKDSISLFTMDAFEIGMLSAARFNLFYQIGYNLSPLTRFDFIILHNPVDNSFVLFPIFNYSVIENLDLSLISLFFEGENFDEFGSSGKMIFIRLKYSF